MSNRQFAAFLVATGWRPTEERNFVRHWVDGQPAAGTEEDPVCWVNLADARAYAAWAGKRLPSDAEWQRAAQGPSWSKPRADEDSPEGILNLRGRLFQLQMPALVRLRLVPGRALGAT